MFLLNEQPDLTLMASLATDVAAILHRRGRRLLSHTDQLVPDAWVMLLDRIPDQTTRNDDATDLLRTLPCASVESIDLP